MGICYAFMIPVDGWLTKQLRPHRRVPPRGHRAASTPIWDIPLEEYAYAFAAR